MREDSISAARTALLDPDQHRAGPPAAGSTPTRYDVLGWGSLITRLLGAGAVLITGVIHLQAYNGPYSAVPTIDALFLVNFGAAMAIGVALLLPLERLVGRWGGVAVVLASVAGVVLAAVSLAMLAVSERGTLFGFHEPGYDPTAISRSRVAEIVALCLLTVSLALRVRAKTRPRW